MDKRRGSVAEIWRVEMKQSNKSWDSEVMQTLRDMGADEDSPLSNLISVAIDVCDSLIVAGVIHRRYNSQAVRDEQISFADIFEQVNIGLREHKKDDVKEFLKEEMSLRLAESMGIDESFM
jgi:hypothetical protein